jgi:glyoxylase-like metal-dependent hydrolase (beta-lactamase superfamily II)
MSPTRRTVLAAGPALGAVLGTASLIPGAARAQTPGGTPVSGYYRYKVGDIEVTAFHEGTSPRPLDAGFVRNAPLDQVQGALAKAFLPTDKLNITFTTLVVKTGRNTALIDTGFADNGGPTTGQTYKNLPAAGIDPKAIDTVIFSHFHGDHILGARLKDGTLAYPNARMMVPEPEWAFWMDEGQMSRAPEGMKPAFQTVRRVFGPEASKVERFAWGKEILPGITAMEAPGHTPGHTIFAITSGNARLMAVSDITNHPALFVRNPDWSAVFDMDADQARATRRRVLDMAAADKVQVAFYHAPFPATGHIAKDGNGFELVPVQWGL